MESSTYISFTKSPESHSQTPLQKFEPHFTKVNEESEFSNVHKLEIKSPSPLYKLRKYLLENGHLNPDGSLAKDSVLNTIKKPIISRAEVIEKINKTYQLNIGNYYLLFNSWIFIIKYLEEHPSHDILLVGGNTPKSFLPSLIKKLPIDSDGKRYFLNSLSLLKTHASDTDLIIVGEKDSHDPIEPQLHTLANLWSEKLGVKGMVTPEILIKNRCFKSREKFPLGVSLTTLDHPEVPLDIIFCQKETVPYIFTIESMYISLKDLLSKHNTTAEFHDGITCGEWMTHTLAKICYAHEKKRNTYFKESGYKAVFKRLLQYQTDAHISPKINEEKRIVTTFVDKELYRFTNEIKIRHSHLHGHKNKFFAYILNSIFLIRKYFPKKDKSLYESLALKNLPEGEGDFCQKTAKYLNRYPTKPFFEALEFVATTFFFHCEDEKCVPFFESCNLSLTTQNGKNSVCLNIGDKQHLALVHIPIREKSIARFTKTLCSLQDERRFEEINQLTEWLCPFLMGFVNCVWQDAGLSLEPIKPPDKNDSPIVHLIFLIHSINSASINEITRSLLFSNSILPKRRMKINLVNRILQIKEEKEYRLLHHSLCKKNELIIKKDKKSSCSSLLDILKKSILENISLEIVAHEVIVATVKKGTVYHIQIASDLWKDLHTLPCKRMDVRIQSLCNIITALSHHDGLKDKSLNLLDLCFLSHPSVRSDVAMELVALVQGDLKWQVQSELTGLIAYTIESDSSEIARIYDQLKDHLSISSPKLLLLFNKHFLQEKELDKVQACFEALLPFREKFKKEISIVYQRLFSAYKEEGVSDKAYHCLKIYNQSESNKNPFDKQNQLYKILNSFDETNYAMVLKLLAKIASQYTVLSLPCIKKLTKLIDTTFLKLECDDQTQLLFYLRDIASFSEAILLEKLHAKLLSSFLIHANLERKKILLTHYSKIYEWKDAVRVLISIPKKTDPFLEDVSSQILVSLTKTNTMEELIIATKMAEHNCLKKDQFQKLFHRILSHHDTRAILLAWNLILNLTPEAIENYSNPRYFINIVNSLIEKTITSKNKKELRSFIREKNPKKFDSFIQTLLVKRFFSSIADLLLNLAKENLWKPPSFLWFDIIEHTLHEPLQSWQLYLLAKRKNVFRNEDHQKQEQCLNNIQKEINRVEILDEIYEHWLRLSPSDEMGSQWIDFNKKRMHLYLNKNEFTHAFKVLDDLVPYLNKYKILGTEANKLILLLINILNSECDYDVSVYQIYEKYKPFITEKNPFLWVAIEDFYATRKSYATQWKIMLGNTTLKQKKSQYFEVITRKWNRLFYNSINDRAFYKKDVAQSLFELVARDILQSKQFIKGAGDLQTLVEKTASWNYRSDSKTNKSISKINEDLNHILIRAIWQSCKKQKSRAEKNVLLVGALLWLKMGLPNLITKEKKDTKMIDNLEEILLSYEDVLTSFLPLSSYRAKYLIMVEDSKKDHLCQRFCQVCFFRNSLTVAAILIKILGFWVFLYVYTDAFRKK